MTLPGFSSQEIVVRTGDGLNFTLMEEFTYTSRGGDIITVPVGATSDGASTPRELWLTLPPFGRYWLAAFLHDYLYRSTQWPKQECDRLLLEAMEHLGVPEIEALTIYEGVKLGGGKAFAEDRVSK